MNYQGSCGTGGPGVAVTKLRLRCSTGHRWCKKNFKVHEWVHVLCFLVMSKAVRAEKGSWHCLHSPWELQRPKEEQWLCKALSRDVPLQGKYTHQKSQAPAKLITWMGRCDYGLAEDTLQIASKRQSCEKII